MKKIYGKDITGNTFGKWTVVEFAERVETSSGKYKYFWKCICECGKEAVVRTINLKNGTSKSCGCFRSELLRKYKTTHGLCRTRFYRIYRIIVQRCNDSNNISFKNYGGRGIKCPWKSFEDFRDDMYESYLEHVKKFEEEDTSIDRINNDLGYSVENCKWSTRKEQTRNRRSNRLITFNGETKCVTEWAEEYKIPRTALFGRVYRGWTIEKTLTTPYCSGRSKK